LKIEIACLAALKKSCRWMKNVFIAQTTIGKTFLRIAHQKRTALSCAVSEQESEDFSFGAKRERYVFSPQPSSRQGRGIYPAGT
jgi:hypothetical protein